MDAWSGTLYGKPFILNVYEKKPNGTIAHAQHQSHLFLVGLSYNRRPIQAVVFNKTIWWVRFSANYATFATPNAGNGNPIYALDLVTGQLISDSRAVKIAGFWNEMRGGYSGQVSGLPFTANSSVGKE